MSENLNLSTGGKLFTSLLAFLIRTPLDAWALCLLWGWFVAPLGAPPLSFWQALGLDVTIGLITVFVARVPIDEQYQLCPPSVWSLGKVIAVLSCVLTGWAIHTITMAVQ